MTTETDSKLAVVLSLLLGLALVGGAVWLLTYAATVRGAAAGPALDVDGGIADLTEESTVDPARDGDLIHLSGAATVPGPLLDPVTGFQVDGLLLVRRSQTLVRVQEHASEGRSRVSYEWRDGGPEGFRYTVFRPPSAVLGAFAIDDLLDWLHDDGEVVDCGDPRVEPPPELGAWTCDEDGFHRYPDDGSGEQRFRYEVVGPEVSLLARQVDGRLQQVEDSSARYLKLISPGIHSSDAILGAAMLTRQGEGNLIRNFAFVVLAIGAFLAVSAVRRWRRL